MVAFEDFLRLPGVRHACTLLAASGPPSAIDSITLLLNHAAISL